ncbi:MAG: shikimate kinase, partial [Bdellovibrionales bacterium]
MITLLIGHRGTGKTSFLRALKAAKPELTVFDLDEEIEKSSGVGLAEIFKRGEAHFRECERDCLTSLLKNENAVVAVGAGFEGPIPQNAHVVWLRRSTDSAGRSFLNRPRLDPKISPLEEYRERFFERERRFEDWAHEQIFLPEGGAGLEGILTDKISVPFDVTLMPEDFRNIERFLSRRQVRRWELRDDLLTAEQIEVAFKIIPAKNILFSRRQPQGEVPHGVALDWPLELGEPPPGTAIVSLHERQEDFTSTLQRLTGYEGQLKLAVEVKDFTELKAGHEWYLQSPEQRSFLPRSQDGRWSWYRSLFGPRMSLHYIREGLGSSLDQPTLWQTLAQPAFKGHFAAVLGHPVEHSRSPQEHLGFFKTRAMPFVAVNIPEEEYTFALELLQLMGLQNAAVTAPLKKIAWAQAHILSKEARKTQSVNSLYFEKGKILAHNTDVLALEQIRHELDPVQAVWLWGGGGVKASVRAVWPELTEKPARQGTEKTDSPDLLIWATGRQNKFVWPPLPVRPK